MAELQMVEAVRAWVSYKMAFTLNNIRIHVAGIDGNCHVAELLQGEKGELVLADLIEVVMNGMEHRTKVTRLQDGGGRLTSQARKAARGRI